ncbi:MAG: hypothetical protein VSS52_000220 [Thiotrichaceae bacterium]|nr:hypothetical protein [Thiotrichaceae bacterium]
MLNNTIYHALVLNLHQPSGNLEHLLKHNFWEAKEILWALDRIPRSLCGYEDVARVHLAMSGTLLETLKKPEFQDQVYGITKIGDFLWQLQNTQIFEILGTGFYHPVFPLTPAADWIEQLQRWQQMGQHLFWRTQFDGFWPPEMGFCMEMIPYLKRMGYRYVLVDSEHVEPVEEMSWQELRYRPHIAEYEGDEIIIIVRDRELSNAQESGMDFGWFEHEAHERTKWCNFPPLITTCTDGDNGGWFRNTNLSSNFWHVFYRKFLDNVRQGYTELRPTFIDEYLNKHGAFGQVKVHTAAWNTGWHNGTDFVQWTGSDLQKQALERVKQVSGAFHELKDEIQDSAHSLDIQHLLSEAHWHLLRAETSCHFFWGESWVSRSHDDLDIVEQLLTQITASNERKS